MVRLEKASVAPITNQFVRYTATDAEIDQFYEEVEALAARAPALSYYFSRVYWQMRNDEYYGPNTVSLTLSPTSVIKNDPDQNHRSASWSLVKSECGGSKYWTNTNSMSGQFNCHYQGQVLVYRGVISPFGDWDLEPIRPSTNYFNMVANKCNPKG